MQVGQFFVTADGRKWAISGETGTIFILVSFTKGSEVIEIEMVMPTSQDDELTWVEVSYLGDGNEPTGIERNGSKQSLSERITEMIHSGWVPEQ